MAKQVTIDAREGHFGISLSTSTVCAGVHVDNVVPRDLCALAGIRSGCVITHLDGRGVSEHAEAMETLDDAKSAEKKVTFVWLDAEGAKEQGASESASRKKWIRRGCVLLAITALLLVGLYNYVTTHYHREIQDYVGDLRVRAMDNSLASVAERGERLMKDAMREGAVRARQAQ